MAIAFARLEVVSRSKGSNACLKAAYNERAKINCERTGQTFFFGHRDGNVHHEVLLPEGADSKFNQAKILWNAAEKAEKRHDSQVAYDMVIALPDDKQITLADKIALARRFLDENFVSKGLAVQLDIHSPHENERNWHAHALITTRRFSKDGQDLGEKARDLNPTFYKGQVMEGDIWGEKWREIQNAYFQEKGYDLAVDENGIIPQEHLGPVRMRRFMGDTEIGLRSELTQQANEQLAKDPESILAYLTRHHATFKEADLNRFLDKHVDEKDRTAVKETVFKSPNLLQLWEKDSNHPLGIGEERDLFTTRKVRGGEQRIVRISETVNARNDINVTQKIANKVLARHSLTEDQQQVFLAATGIHKDYEDKGLVIVQGRAGTGKSFTLNAIREAYETDGIHVLGLAPTNTIVQDLNKDAGFTEAKTIHKMLFNHKSERELLPRGSVLVVDEAGMIPNDAFSELLQVAKSTKSKVILMGDERQLPSVSRSGMFAYLADKHGSIELSDIKRQEIDWQKEVSKHLSQGKTKEALQILQSNDRIHWSDKKEQAAHELVNAWKKAHLENPEEQKLIITHTNHMVESFNKAVRHHLKSTGVLSETEYECMTVRANKWLKIRVGVGDRIQFTQTKTNVGISNGILGTLQEVREKENNSFEFTVKQDNGKEVTFDPAKFHGFTLGYASTVYKAQGKTKPSVFVYHDGKSSKPLSYVSLTRQKNDLHLFVSAEKTKDFKTLVWQMSAEQEKTSSLNYLSVDDINQKREQLEKQSHLKNEEQKLNPLSFFIKHTLKDKLQEIGQNITTKVKDHLYQNNAFYKLPSTQRDGHHTVVRLDRIHAQRQESTLASDPKTLDKQKSPDHNQEVKKYTPEIEKQEQLLRELQEKQRDLEKPFAI